MKTLQQHINEKLIINKDFNDGYKTPEEFDEKIVSILDFDEGTFINNTSARKNTIGFTLNILTAKLDVKLINEDEIIEKIHNLFGTYKTKKFSIGKYVQQKHSGIYAKSMQKLLNNVENFEKHWIYKEKKFNIFYILGEKYTVLSIGNEEVAFSYLVIKI